MLKCESLCFLKSVSTPLNTGEKLKTYQPTRGVIISETLWSLSIRFCRRPGCHAASSVGFILDIHAIHHPSNHYFLDFHPSHSVPQVGHTFHRIQAAVPKPLNRLLEDLWGRRLWSDLPLSPCTPLMLYDPWNRPCICRHFEDWHSLLSSPLLSFPLPFAFCLFLLTNGWAYMRRMAGDR